MQSTKKGDRQMFSLRSPSVWFAVLVFAPLCLHPLSSWSSDVNAGGVDYTLFRAANEADFFGVLECETSGVLIGRYRVIDSFRGATVGTLLSVSQDATDLLWEGTSHLVGQRFFAALKHVKTPVPPDPYGVISPIEFRGLPANYIFLAEWPIREHYEFMGESIVDTASFSDKLRSFLGLSPEKRRLELIERALNCHFSPSPTPDELCSEQARWTTSAEAVDFFIKLLSRSEYSNSFLEKIAVEVDAKKVLDQVSSSQVTFRVPLLLESLKFRANQRIAALSEDVNRRAISHMSTNCIREMHLIAANTGSSASLRLPLVNRDMVVDDLKVLPNDHSRETSHAAYLYGSFVAAGCKQECPALFFSWLNVPNDWVRVVGAVYLAVWHDPRGVEALQKLALTTDRPGLLASLALARRGDRVAMDRVVQALGALDWINGEDVSYRLVDGAFQAEAKALLLNSAFASGIKIDPTLTSGSERLVSEKLKNFWKQHREVLRLRDPWLSELEARHVD
jgi:hypothetical protein